MSAPVPFGRFLLLERIDAGGMAEVFAARATSGEETGRLVAVKRMLPAPAEDPELVAMFLDEARIAVQLDHPGIARILDLGRHGESYYIAMEYVPGRDLRALLAALGRRGARMPVPLAVHVACRLLDALDHAHRRRDAAGRGLGIVHRDVSPQNVLLAFTGEVKLVDFGVALARRNAARRDTAVLRGKLPYVSPEQSLGRPVDGRSDVFSAAAVLHEMLTGSRLFAAESDLAVLEKVRAGQVAPPSRENPEVPPGLDRAVLWALARDPADRPASAGELASELAQHQAGADAERLGSLVCGCFPEEARRERERR